jgi:hypothetical protein
MTEKTDITAAYLQSIMDYDPETGSLRWKHRADASPEWNSNHAGKPAGASHKRGYRRIKIDRREYQAHRLVWLWVTGNWPQAEIDHINLDRADNRFCNLRAASRSQNKMNKPRQSNNTSGFKGVSWNRSRQKWLAQIKHDGQVRYLGFFDDPSAAHAVYCEAADKYFGEFARTA